MQRNCKTSLRDRMKDGLHMLLELQTNALQEIDLCLWTNNIRKSANHYKTVRAGGNVTTRSGLVNGNVSEELVGREKF